MVGFVECLFWGSLALLAYTYAGYPIVCWIWGRLFPRPIRSLAGSLRSPLTVILVAYNEESRIEARLRNLVSGGLEPEDQILVMCDGCGDRTAQVARDLAERRIEVVELPRGGKAAALNEGVARARGAIVVFCDARQRFAPDAIPRLLRHFEDEKIGAVSGNLEIEASEAGAGKGVDLYWKLEKFVRKWEAKFDSTIGCTGAIYAIRRNLYEPIPADTLLDDVVIPMRIALRGYRVAFDEEAKAYEPQRLEPERERRRKSRTLAGNYQMLFRYPSWILPWRSRLWFQLICHKYLRLTGMLWLIVCAATSCFLATQRPLFLWICCGEALLFALACAGLVFRNVRLKFVTIPAAFLFLQWTSVEALFFYVRMVRRRRAEAGPVW